MVHSQKSCVVGYSTADTSVGNQAAGVCFIPVAGEGTMADIKITGYGDEYGDTRISCGKLDTFGRTITRMFWYDLPEDPVEGWEAQYGWWDALGETEYNNEKLTAGEGLWFSIGESGVSIQSAGQVLSESLPISLVKGNNQLVANPMPCTLDMGEIFVTGYGDEYGDTRISCGKLDTFGRTITRMFWFDLPEDPVEGWEAQYGWWDALGETEYNAEKLAAGESLWINCGEANITINFPTPLAK